MILFTIRYKEIALKGKLIHRYEQILRENILRLLEQYTQTSEIDVSNNVRIYFRQKIGYIEVADEYAEILESVLKKTFGIARWGRVFEYPRTLTTDQLAEKISQEVLSNYGIREVRLEVKRHDKSYKKNSQDIFIEVGQELRKIGITVTKTSQTRLLLNIEKKTYQISIVQNGLGGLPVGSAGRCMLLLSGGIDSPVAGLLMAKRGLHVDCIHFYPDEEKDSEKIKNIAIELKKYIPNLKLYRVSEKLIKKHIPPIKSKFNVLLYKFGMTDYAYRYAMYRWHGKDFCIANGDNLSQVASQTLSNLNALNHALGTVSQIKSSVFRPLLAYDKTEIIELARKFSVYELSILPYYDGCSAVANKHNRKTLADVDRFAKDAEILINSVEFNPSDVEKVPL